MRFLSIFFLISLNIIFLCNAGIQVEYKVSYAKENKLVNAKEQIPYKMILSVEGENAKIQKFYSRGATYEMNLFYRKNDQIYVAQQLEKHEFWRPHMRYNETVFRKITKNFNTVYPVQKVEYKIQHLDNTSQLDVMKYPCKRAIGELDNQKIEILYTEKLNHEFFQHGNLKGIALHYKVQDRIFDEIIYTATSVKEDIEFNRNYFNAPKFNNDFFNVYTDNKFINSIAENIKVRDLSNKKVELNFDDNKITVLNFWAVYDSISHEEIYKLNYLHQKYKEDKRVQFISISEDPSQYFRHFVNANEIELQAYGSGSRAIRQYDAEFLPTNVVIAPGGKIIFHRTHYWPTTAFYINYLIEKLLNKHFATIEQ